MNVLTEMQQIDSNEVGAYAEFDVRQTTTGNFQIDLGNAASWGATVLTLYRSNDRVNWAAMATPTTATAVGFLASDIDSSTINYLRWETTTANGAAGFFTIAPSFKGSF